MATVIEIPCPNCEKPLKVPESVFGKKIKCKHCNHPFVVEDPDAEEKPKKPAVKPSKPGGAAVKAKKEEPKKEAPKEEPKKEEPAPYKFADDDDDEGAKPNPLGVIDEGEDIPRCPFCAQELDPPDAKVCLHCGFNNMTRTRAESKKVWAPDSNDYINHLGPGIAAAIGAIVLLVLNILVFVNMRDWMMDTFLMKEEPGADGQPAFLIKPGAFIAFVLAATILPLIKLTRFAIKRLAIENKPTEKVKT